MLAASTFMIVFRFLHIVAGALWVGSAFLFVGFIGPSAVEVGPSSGPLLRTAVKKRRVVTVIDWLGVTTVVAGWVLWIKHANDFGAVADWVGTRFGLGITIGAVIATATFIVGFFGVGRNVDRLVELGEEVTRRQVGNRRPSSRRGWTG